jgi:hypothetical protein
VEIYAIRNFVIFILRQKLVNNQTNEDGLGGPCSMHVSTLLNVAVASLAF